MPARTRKTDAARREQLRRAKRAQRARQRRANIVDVQLSLPAPVAAKLAAARRAPQFAQQLNDALDRLVVRLADYPQLEDLAWNRVDEYISASDAFNLYERNWRLVDPAALGEHERALIERLKTELGNGEINA